MSETRPVGAKKTYNRSQDGGQKRENESVVSYQQLSFSFSIFYIIKE